ncbi:MAG: type II toxin-antitoxin system RelE/ParE family toxin [Lachnospiraceae bacterium]|jgi:phage-related protein|nr:type II toxin-antitoxin system RelE/ParE family toxin [Lachnospiraceae bacterium]
MDKFSIEFYTKENGEKPAKEFLLCTDKKMRAKLSGILELLEEYGNQVREPYSKHLEDGIFEIRGKIGNNISRVLYFFYFEGRIILTNGFVKKTQKTPRQEIELAKKYRKDFVERMRKDERIP